MDILGELNYLRKLGYFKRFEDKGEYYLCTCPFHNDGNEKKPAFGITKVKKVLGSGDNKRIMDIGHFHCLACGEKGRFTQLLARLYDKPEHEILLQLRDRLIYENSRTLKISFEIEEVEIEDGERLSLDDKARNYLNNRKISDVVIELFGISMDSSGNIIFPLLNKFGKLIAVQKRSTDKKMFFNSKNLDKLSFLYAFDKIDIFDSSPVYVVESIIDCLTLWSWGYRAVAIMGVVASDYHILELSMIRGDIVVAFDNDEAGRKLTNEVYYRLKDKRRGIRKFNWGRYLVKDINDLSLEKFKTLERI